MNKQKSVFLAIILSLLGLTLYSCGGGGSNNSETTRPTATVSPDSPATINGTTSIIISFNTSMETSSLSLGGSMAAESNGGVWSATSSSNDRLNISPATSWSDGVKTLTLDVDDSTGTALATLNLSYTVDATLQVPSVSPANGSTIANSSAIVITYAETIDIVSLAVAGSMWGESDGGAWSATVESNDTLTVQPASVWSTPAGILDITVNDLVGNSRTVNLSYTISLDGDGDGYLVSEGDCDDADASIYPGAIEVCDGKDNDCNGGTLDGSVESWVGQACDGTDSDLCLEGTYSCTSGIQSCSDSSGNDAEVCDGLDNDCNPATADGSDETWYGDACDGADSDLCQEGTYSCTAGSQSCSDSTGSNVEVCDGEDNDCDGSVDEGGIALCDDGESCTTDVCAGASGCQNTSVADGTACGDHVCNECSAGTCVDSATGTPGPGCNSMEATACTAADTCEAGGVCSENHNPPGTLCDDGDACTIGETCNGTGVCSGTPLNCDDGLSCTAESCDSVIGCINNIVAGSCLIDGSCYADDAENPSSSCQICNASSAPSAWSDKADGAICNDGDPGTIYDQCVAGVCVGEADVDGDGSPASLDCDDYDPNNYPGNSEVCDRQDNDCNGTADGTNEVNNDGDPVWMCEGDCNDNDPSNYPGNSEVCDGYDNNCNGSADYPGGEVDGDGDGFLSCNDCNDTDPNVYPGNGC